MNIQYSTTKKTQKKKTHTHLLAQTIQVLLSHLTLLAISASTQGSQDSKIASTPQSPSPMNLTTLMTSPTCVTGYYYSGLSYKVLHYYDS